MPKVYNRNDRNTPDLAIYCGRGSIAGNPFIIGEDGTRDEVCDKYEAWAPKQKWWRPFIREARGRDLVCHCKPKRCHCDFILKAANG